jgi:hypothetical protein
MTLAPRIPECSTLVQVAFVPEEVVQVVSVHYVGEINHVAVLQKPIPHERMLFLWLGCRVRA